MKIKTIFQQFMISSAAVALLGVAPVVMADELKTTGYVAGSQKFDVGFPVGKSSSPNAGGFKGTWNGDDIIFWCIELDQYFGFNNTYTDYTASEPDNATMTLLGQLFTEAYGVATSDAQHSAAFQLAIWEIVYNPGGLDLYSGTFYVKATPAANPYYGHPGTVALAQSWLTNLGNFADQYNLLLLHSATHQDFVTPGKPFRFEAPEPNALWLMVVAFAAMFAVSRRRLRVTA